MTCVDTNALVRVLTNDDPTEAERAAAVLRAGPTWVARTVLLETEWVLRFTYGYDREAIAAAFTALLGLGSLEVESGSAVRKALGWYRTGLDFADALHLASAPDGASEMVTFDRAFARRAIRIGAAPPVRALR